MKNTIPDRHGPLWYLSIVLREYTGLLVLNLLVILTSLPVFTLGPSLSAFGHVLCRMVDDQPVEPAREYFAAFKAQFSRKVGWGLALLAITAVLGVSLWFYGALAGGSALWVLPTALSLLGLILVWGVAIHLFPLLSSETPPDAPLKAAAMEALATLPFTGLSLAVSLLMLLAQALTFPFSVPVTLLFGLSLPALACAFPCVPR